MKPKALRTGATRAVAKTGGTNIADYADAETLSANHVHRARDGVEKEIYQELRVVTVGRDRRGAPLVTGSVTLAILVF